MTFSELILKILHENSGGIKHLDLYVRVIECLRAGEVKDKDFPHISGSRTARETEQLEEVFEKKLSEIPEIGILEYGWNMGGDTVRLKMFVYTPLTGEKA